MLGLANWAELEEREDGPAPEVEITEDGDEVPFVCGCADCRALRGRGRGRREGR